MVSIKLATCETLQVTVKVSTFASSYEVPNGVYNPGQDAVLNIFLDQRTNHYQGLLKMPRTSASKSPKSVKAKVVPKPRKRLKRSLFRTENRPASASTLAMAVQESLVDVKTKTDDNKSSVSPVDGVAVKADVTPTIGTVKSEMSAVKRVPTTADVTLAVQTANKSKIDNNKSSDSAMKGGNGDVTPTISTVKSEMSVVKEAPAAADVTLAVMTADKTKIVNNKSSDSAVKGGNGKVALTISTIKSEMSVVEEAPATADVTLAVQTADKTKIGNNKSSNSAKKGGSGVVKSEKLVEDGDSGVAGV